MLLRRQRTKKPKNQRCFGGLLKNPKLTVNPLDESIGEVRGQRTDVDTIISNLLAQLENDILVEMNNRKAGLAGLERISTTAGPLTEDEEPKLADAFKRRIRSCTSLK